MTENVSAYHLATRPELYEPQRENSFQFIVTGLNGLTRPGMSGDEENSDMGGDIYVQEVLKLSVVSWNGTPTFSQEEVAVQLGNSTIYFAGKPSFSEGTLTLNDYIGADDKVMLQAWQNLSYNLTENAVSSVALTNYKRTCYVVEMTPEMKEVRRYVLEGCWIKSLDFGTYTYESGGKKTVAATIRYDRAYLDVSGGVQYPLGGHGVAPGQNA